MVGFPVFSYQLDPETMDSAHAKFVHQARLLTALSSSSRLSPRNQMSLSGLEPKDLEYKQEEWLAKKSDSVSSITVVYVSFSTSFSQQSRDDLDYYSLRGEPATSIYTHVQLAGTALGKI